VRRAGTERSSLARARARLFISSFKRRKKRKKERKKERRKKQMMMTSVLLHTFDGQSDVESIRAFVVLHGQIVVTGVVHFDALDT
jgi:hypothetical protein